MLHKTVAAQPANDGQREVEADRQLADDALAVPVWRYIGNMVFHGLRGAVQAYLAATHTERAARGAYKAKQRLRAFCGAGTHQPVQTQYFSLAHTERKVFHSCTIRQMFNLKHRAAYFGLLFRVQHGHFPAYHLRHHFLL